MELLIRDASANEPEFTAIADAKLEKATRHASKLKNPEAAALLQHAVLAGRRGQRSYAEQLFSRAAAGLDHAQEDADGHAAAAQGRGRDLR